MQKNTAPTLHITSHIETLVPATPTNPRKETYGWRCTAHDCRIGMTGYTDKRASLKDAADHEQRQALALFPTGTLITAIGPAGSGKSRFAAAFPSTWVISLDTLRKQISDDAGDQNATTEAVQLQDLLLDARLRRGLTTLLDSTNCEPAVRARLIERAHRYNRSVAALVFSTPLKTCEARNARREDNSVRVPLDVLRRQHQQTQLAIPQLHREGFTDVRIVGTDS
ncbi:AAA family ATPase [Kitasatospora sp. NPDC059795]|uniref:AAA family ATPase n=1 Tax=Kitasatospora sp. NPDC059795 TaxID=3346949 RepID=UPI00364C2B2C